MDGIASMSKQFQWNNSLFYGYRLSGKVLHGDYLLQTVCPRKSLKWNRVPLIRRQVVWRNYSEHMTEK